MKNKNIVNIVKIYEHDKCRIVQQNYDRTAMTYFCLRPLTHQLLSPSCRASAL